MSSADRDPPAPPPHDPAPPHTQALAAELQARIAPLRTGGAAYALLDWPRYANVGDSAIWMGALAVLGRVFGAPPAFVTAHSERAEGLGRVCPEGPIFLLGGGNFGDLWPGFQAHRVWLLERFRHRRVVQLPQSIHFTTEAARDDMARAIAGHPDFTLMVRDRQSLTLARRHFDCETLLVPDMAYGLGRLHSAVEPVADVFSLLRTDREGRLSPELTETLTRLGPVDDWVHEPPLSTLRERAERRLARMVPALKGPLVPRLERSFRRIAALRVQRGADLLAQGRVVVTDRLHGHIMSTLLGRPHVVLDNSYGKVTGFVHAWTDDGLTRIATTPEEAAAAVRELLAKLPAAG